MERMQQIHRAKRVENMQIKEEELYKYLINPIQVDKAKKEELDKEYKDASSGYIVEYDKRSKNDKPDKYLQKKITKGYIVSKEDLERKTNGNKKIREWWGGRTNQPYKNILKKENYEKQFKNKDDLIVHRVTKKDRNKVLLDEELSKLEELLAEHNDQLKLVYSKQQKAKHKKKFQYTNIYKYRMTHNAKDWKELRDFHEKEQSKIDKKDKKIDNMINLLMDIDTLDDEEGNKIKQKLKALEDKTLKDRKYDINSEIDLELEKLEKEVGKKEFKKIMDEINTADKKSRKVLVLKDKKSTDDSVSTKSDRNKKRVKVIMNKESNGLEESKSTKSGYVDISTIEKYKSKTGHVDSDIIEEYKNRQINKK
jgi:hypothetical protein